MDPYSASLYYPAEIARIVQINSQRILRWLRGYDYSYAEKRIHRPPVLGSGQDLDSPLYASFYDLIDLLFVKEFLAKKLSLQKVRNAFNEAEQLLGTRHFVHQTFFTDGKNIYLRVVNKGDAILELLTGGQWAIKDFVEQFAQEVDFDKTTKSAVRWFPSVGGRLVVLDPLISFGRPSILGKGITTENIYNLYCAEGERIEPVADWLDLSKNEVSAAIRFELSIAA